MGPFWVTKRHPRSQTKSKWGAPEDQGQRGEKRATRRTKTGASAEDVSVRPPREENQEGDPRNTREGGKPRTNTREGGKSRTTGPRPALGGNEDPRNPHAPSACAPDPTHTHTHTHTHTPVSR